MKLAGGERSGHLELLLLLDLVDKEVAREVELEVVLLVGEEVLAHALSFAQVT